MLKSMIRPKQLIMGGQKEQHAQTLSVSFGLVDPMPQVTVTELCSVTCGDTCTGDGGWETQISSGRRRVPQTLATEKTDEEGKPPGWAAELECSSGRLA